MAGELPLDWDDRKRLETIRLAAAEDVAGMLDEFDDDLDKVAFIGGLLVAADGLDDLVWACRDGEVWWTSLAWALGEYADVDPDDELVGLRTGRRVSSRFRRRGNGGGSGG